MVNTITQVMLAKPECRHIACFVVEACLRRPSCLPRAAECLIRQPECGLVLLFWELQVIHIHVLVGGLMLLFGKLAGDHCCVHVCRYVVRPSTFRSKAR